ncbi:hypothetical protein EG329_000648 [Mollisiaceae sp. DMI_Dod_QoI]|nr:hypothetical protein EG329_000648 [Helotiales sp. DMI_Dod_QoI]
MDTTTSCSWCYESPAIVKCESCVFSVYCSKECRDQDTEFHVVICQGSENFQKQNPKPVYHLSLLLPEDVLPEDELPPRFIWLKFDLHNPPAELSERPNTAEYIPQSHIQGTKKVKNVIISCGDKKVEIIAAETGFRDGSKENRCLTHLMHGKEQYSWRGPILVLRRTHLNNYTDVQVSDLQIVKKYFTDRMSLKRKRNDDMDLACNFTAPRLNIAGGYTAVMISCLGDMKEFGHAKFSQVRVTQPPLDTKYEGPYTSISDRLGFGLIFYKYDSGIICNSTSEDKDEQGKPWQHLTNFEMRALFVETCGLRPRRGKAFDQAGTYLVVRKDRRGLLPQHVEALERFSRELIMPGMEQFGIFLGDSRFKPTNI